LKGEVFTSKICSKLGRDFHLAKDIVEDCWKWIAKDYEGVSQEEIRYLREYENMGLQRKSQKLEKCDENYVLSF
jgi:hypothetical protein